MGKAQYSTYTSTNVPLAAAAVKSILGVRGPTGIGVDLKKIRISFDGVTASAVPVVVDLCYATFATNPPNTASTAETVVQVSGRTITPGFTSARNWSAEPTVLTVIDSYLLSPAGGLVVYDIPLGDTPDSAAAEGFVIRCNAPAIVNARASMWFERV